MHAITHFVRHHVRCRRGYNLVELMFAVAFSGIILVASVPRFSSFKDSQDLRSAALALSRSEGFGGRIHTNTIHGYAYFPTFWDLVTSVDPRSAPLERALRSTPTDVQDAALKTL